MAIAGHPAALRVAASDVTGSEVSGIHSMEFGPSANLLDVTDFADTTGAIVRIQGLKDLTITCSGDYVSGDTGQSLIRTSWTSGADIYVRVLPDGSTGFKCACKVQDYKITPNVDGTVEFSATFMGNGSIGTV